MLAQNDISTGTDRAVLEAALGLDKPIYEQYFVWILNITQGDFGYSLWQNTSVAEQLSLTLPITFELGLLALIVALTVAIPIGIYSAMKQDTVGDYVTRSFFAADVGHTEFLAWYLGNGVPLSLVAMGATAAIHAFF